MFQLPLMLFILNVVLVFPIFFPNLSDMNMWDESIYINSGKRLVAECHLPVYAWNPLVAFLYGLVYIPLQRSPYWLIHSSTIGRFILFGLLWASSYLVAKQISHLSHPLLMIALLFVSPTLTNLLRNPSDALFAAMSALSFWQVLLFYHCKKPKHLWMSSVFMGLAALSRNDGLILFLIFTPLCILLSMKVNRISTSLAACIIPFVIAVGGYVGLYGASTGNFTLGTLRRTYTAFEQGQGVAYWHLYTNTTKSPFVEGRIEARRLFGTPEENRYSVIAAISRNPRAFLQRIVQIAKRAPGQLLSIYGEGLGLVLFLLAARGLIEIAIKKLYLLLCLMLLWPAHLFVYFLTFFRHQYFLLPYFVIFSLASVGLSSILSNSESRKERCLWSATLLGSAILGMAMNEPFIFQASLVFMLSLWIIWMIMNQSRDLKAMKLVGLILVLCLALVMRGSYPSPKFRKLGIAPDERAALFMREHLEPGARVMSYAPGNVWIANMTHVPVDRIRYMTSEQELSAWMVNRNLKAIYVDKALRNYYPEAWALIKRQIGKSLQVGFTSKAGDVQVLLVTISRQTPVPGH